jgi:hypothetical protein
MSSSATTTLRSQLGHGEQDLLLILSVEFAHRAHSSGHALALAGSASCSSVGLVVGQVVADGGHEHDVLCGVWWRVAQRLRHGLPAHAKGGTLHELR